MPSMNDDSIEMTPESLNSRCTTRMKALNEAFDKLRLIVPRPLRSAYNYNCGGAVNTNFYYGPKPKSATNDELNVYNNWQNNRLNEELFQLQHSIDTQFNNLERLSYVSPYYFPQLSSMPLMNCQDGNNIFTPIVAPTSNFSLPIPFTTINETVQKRKADEPSAESINQYLSSVYNDTHTIVTQSRNKVPKCQNEQIPLHFPTKNNMSNLLEKLKKEEEKILKKQKIYEKRFWRRLYEQVIGSINKCETPCQKLRNYQYLERPIIIITITKSNDVNCDKTVKCAEIVSNCSEGKSDELSSDTDNDDISLSENVIKYSQIVKLKCKHDNSLIVEQTNNATLPKLSKIATLKLAIQYINILTDILKMNGGDPLPIDGRLIPPLPKRKRRRLKK
ncbi:hypothetical protein SNEBB_000161 [Seison nebaliae]|nr:hypothetical protein SNEBB_000161 [Seison nebaliae]